jgi:hypothetical protein
MDHFIGDLVAQQVIEGMWLYSSWLEVLTYSDHGNFR